MSTSVGLCQRAMSPQHPGSEVRTDATGACRTTWNIGAR